MQPGERVVEPAHRGLEHARPVPGLRGPRRQRQRSSKFTPGGGEVPVPAKLHPRQRRVSLGQPVVERQRPLGCRLGSGKHLFWAAIPVHREQVERFCLTRIRKSVVPVALYRLIVEVDRAAEVGLLAPRRQIVPALIELVGLERLPVFGVKPEAERVPDLVRDRLARELDLAQRPRVFLAPDFLAVLGVDELQLQRCRSAAGFDLDEQ